MHMTRRLAVYLGAPAAAVLLASAAACGTAREPVPADSAETATSCAACHGDRSPGVQPGDPRSAPGYNDGTDVNGRTALDAAATSIGAHAIHLTGGTLGVAVTCDQCHAVPDSVDAAGHLDSDVKLTFGSLATKGGLAPAYDATTQTCSNTYCHGGTPGWRINPVVAPRWSQGSEAIVCGACHDLPPPSPVHINTMATQGCGTPINPAFTCHPAGYSKYTVDPKLHMDGKICPPDCE
jgi:predicted CxxxxCH...CXXCH cytochrome family protein